MSAPGHPITNIVTDELIETVKNLRNNGLKYTEITEQTGLSYPFIKKIQSVMISRGLGKFKKYVKRGGNVQVNIPETTGLGRKREKIVTDSEKENVLKLRNDGLTYREITEQTGLLYPIIKRIEAEKR